MNEVLIKKIIQHKLTAVRKIINKLPVDVSNEVMSLGRMVLECLNESFQEINNQPENKIKLKHELNNIKIE